MKRTLITNVLWASFQIFIAVINIVTINFIGTKVNEQVKDADFVICISIIAVVHSYSEEIVLEQKTITWDFNEKCVVQVKSDFQTSSTRKFD